MTGVRGMKQRPWKTLRCVVEVKVPPGNSSSQGDLKYQVGLALDQHYKAYGPPNHIPMPRATRLDDSNVVKYRVLDFGRVVQADNGKAPAPSFERLVLGGLWIIVSFLIPPKLRSNEHISKWFDDMRNWK